MLSNHEFGTGLRRLGLYLAYLAGEFTWQALPLTTQIAAVQCGTLHNAARWQPCATARTWAVTAAMRTGGLHLTNGALPTVAATPAGATLAAMPRAMRKVG